jgi:hypothetical protein
MLSRAKLFRNGTRPAFLMVYLFLSLAAFCQLQAKNDWAGWEFLLGEWVAGDSNGVPGSASAGSFTLAPDLSGKVLLRKNHAEYPASNGRPAVDHDDLMIVYHEGEAAKAFYVDGEGHVIRYNIHLFPDSKKIVMLSEKAQGAPQYRLTYENVQTGTVKLSFEIASPDKPEEFKKYVEAVVKRK